MCSPCSIQTIDYIATDEMQDQSIVNETNIGVISASTKPVAQQKHSRMPCICWTLVLMPLLCLVVCFNLNFHLEQVFDSILDSINYSFPRFQPAVTRNPRQEPFEWTRILREKRDIILEELETFLVAHPSTMNLLQFDTLLPNQHFLNRDKGWKSIFLRCYGAETSESVKSKFPKTLELVNRLDSRTDIPAVFISILDPHKSIPRHRGYYGGILRYHLTLAVSKHSEDDLYLSLWPDNHPGTEERIQWTNGSDVIFDDRNVHGVVNRINQTRIILFVDLARPDLSFWHDLFNKFMINLVVPRMTDRCSNAMKMQNLVLSMR